MSKNFQDILKELRESKKITQKEVAKAIKVNERTYCNYETGRTEPDIKTLIRLADYYNVSMDILTGRHIVANQTD